MKRNYLIFKSYILSLILLLINNFLINGNILLFEIDIFLYATTWCLVVLVIHRFIKNKLFAYLLFFSCSTTMIFNLGNPMTGMPSNHSFTLLFGLSFYSLTLAYKIYRKNKLTLRDVFIASNPLMIFTGPIAIFFKDISITSFSRRIIFFFPYLIVGIFFYQIIGIPLTNFFFLFDSINTFNVIIYGIIFELFIYFNFAGLSLIVYALLGILGIGIPLNFRQPFSSRNLIEFWRGWHISLSVILKQLFYTPFRKKFNGSIVLFFVFISSAMWHGITFNFLLWGTFHATCYIITKFLLSHKYFKLSTLLMVLGIIAGRILFVESDIERLFMKLSFSDLNIDYSIFFKDNTSLLSLILGLLIVFSEFIFKDSVYYKQKNYKIFRLPLFQISLIILIILLITSSNGVNFAAYGQR